MILEPGVYDMPEATYHGDPVPGGSLSSTVARLLLPPSCPRLARWRADHPEHKDAYDLGSVAHHLILGKGAQYVEVKADDWTLKATRQLRDEKRAQGLIPMLSKQLRAAQRMADAVRAHDIAPRVLQAGGAERVYVWRDEATGVWCRAMLDWAPDPTRPWRLIIGDVKTSADPSPHGFAKSVANYGYHVQAAHYLAGYCAVHDVDPAEVEFWFIAVGKDEPHIVHVHSLSDAALATGRALHRQALATWAECQATGTWPDGSEQIHELSLPRWAS